ncbi:IPT/TIG domain-containing protein [Pedobacter panaciterrae]|uniref:IPT/TIG domain-containing protein n=1 Tax=Pedobacter panaciterrae TaxID=363849 RepID=UPI002597F00E|nr:IPT/TIG domain-containing protein [uncultured Pedobacter sp.]
MKKKSQNYLAIIGIIVTAIFTVQCKKSAPINTTPIKTVITNISPLQGMKGTIVTITGAGFDTVLRTTSVKFNSKSATIKSITATQMIVVVPEEATTGQITVTNKDTVILFPANFTVRSFVITKIPADNAFDGASIVNMAADVTGNVYVNTNTDTVFKISPAGVKSMLTKVGNSSTKLGGIAVDGAGNVYAVGTNDFKIYKVTSAGAVSVFAGSGVSGYADALGTAAQFTAPAGMTIDVSGNLFVTDVYRLRKITPAGQVSTFAGKATPGKVDGQGTSAAFGSYGNLNHIATDASGNVYVSDGDYDIRGVESSAYYIRKITPAGIVSTIGPIPKQMASWTGGKGSVTLRFTSMLAVDVAGNLFLPGSSYNNGTVASGGCCTFGPVFMVNKALNSSEFYDLTGTFSFLTMSYTGITFDPSGNMYISAAVNYGRRMYEPSSMGKTGSLIVKFMIQ